jgi:hypothetical protein
MEKHKPRRGLKALLFGASLVATAYMADNYNVLDSYVRPAIYRNVEIADGFTQHPFDLQKKYLINEEGKLETYLGNSETLEYRALRENGHTERFYDTAMDTAKETLETAVDIVKDFLGF